VQKESKMNFWEESLKIGNVYVPRFIGGPMDGFTDSPFRVMVRQFSPHELLYTEITHATNVVYAADKTNVLRFRQAERPLNFQLTANSLEHIDLACAYILLAGVDMVDFNIGCPARNVVGSGSGSALMANIPCLRAILKRLRTVLSIPLTVKMRAGFKEKNALEVALLAQDEGADALVIHPRLQTHQFKGQPDYSLVAQVKKLVSIPVIISGGVTGASSAKEIHEQTGVDGFMVARALRGAPWKLRELLEKIQGREYHVTRAMMCDVALAHLDAMLDHYGSTGLYMFRKHLAFYVKYDPDACEFRRQLMVEKSVEVIKEGLKAFFQEP